MTCDVCALVFPVTCDVSRRGVCLPAGGPGGPADRHRQVPAGPPGQWPGRGAAAGSDKDDDSPVKPGKKDKDDEDEDENDSDSPKATR